MLCLWVLTSTKHIILVKLAAILALLLATDPQVVSKEPFQLPFSYHISQNKYIHTSRQFSKRLMLFFKETQP